MQNFKTIKITTLKFCEETSTASILIPSLTKLGQYLTLQSEKITNSEFSKQLASSLSQKLNDRLDKLRTEEILGLKFYYKFIQFNFYFIGFAMLMDKRFSYDESIRSKLEWSLIEEEFIIQCKEGKFGIV